jgi:hypothetical protein
MKLTASVRTKEKIINHLFGFILVSNISFDVYTSIIDKFDLSTQICIIFNPPKPAAIHPSFSDPSPPRAIAKYTQGISACDSQSATPSPALPLGEGKGAQRAGRGDFWIMKSSIR